MGSFQVQVLIEPLKKTCSILSLKPKNGSRTIHHVYRCWFVYRVQLAVIIYVYYRERKITCGNIHSVYRSAHTKEAQTFQIRWLNKFRNYINYKDKEEKKTYASCLFVSVSQ